jgi:hypothetical protein
MDYVRPISNSEKSPFLFIDPNIGILERLATSVSDVTACWHDVTRADDVDNSGCIPRTAIQLIVSCHVITSEVGPLKNNSTRMSRGHDTLKRGNMLRIEDYKKKTDALSRDVGTSSSMSRSIFDLQSSELYEYH